MAEQQTKQDRIDRILSDLAVLASLRSGKTLSTSTMTVIDHNSWSSSLWRKYTGEDRNKTFAYIKGILAEAIEIYRTFPSLKLLSGIESALKGVSELKGTYKGDYYAIADIDAIVNDNNRKINSLPLPIIVATEPEPEIISESTFLEPEIIPESKTLDECVAIVIGDVLVTEDPDQKIFPTDLLSYASHTEEVVSTSDRGSISKAIEEPITFDVTSNSSENLVIRFDSNIDSSSSESDHEDTKAIISSTDSIASNDDSGPLWSTTSSVSIASEASINDSSEEVQFDSTSSEESDDESDDESETENETPLLSSESNSDKPEIPIATLVKDTCSLVTNSVIEASDSVSNSIAETLSKNSDEDEIIYSEEPIYTRLANDSSDDEDSDDFIKKISNQQGSQTNRFPTYSQSAQDIDSIGYSTNYVSPVILAEGTFPIGNTLSSLYDESRDTIVVYTDQYCPAFDVESQRWFPSMDEIQSAANDTRNRKGVQYNKQNSDGQLSARFTTPIDATPPIVRLAKAFRHWIDSIAINDDDDEYVDRYAILSL